MKIEPTSVLQFDPSGIDGLAERYGPEKDAEALKAGGRVAAGSFHRDTLKVITRWKSPRPVALIDKNLDSEIADALQLAIALPTTEKAAVETLSKLHGVGIPMASAILTAIHPKKYTVLDYRALESLGVKNWPDTVDFYVSYLEACREIAACYGKSLRNLDRALWQWSWEQSQKKR